MPEGASVSDTENKDDNDADDPHKALDIDLDVYVSSLDAYPQIEFIWRFVYHSNFRPLRSDEVIPKQSYKKVIKNAALKHTTTAKPAKETNETVPEKSHKKKSKSEATHAKEGDINGKSSERKKSKKSKSEKEKADVLDLMGSPVASKPSTKSSKPKKEKKSSKEKGSSKTVKDASKSGYEEALGISTPSKEIY